MTVAVMTSLGREEHVPHAVVQNIEKTQISEKRITVKRN